MTVEMTVELIHNVLRLWVSLAIREAVNVVAPLSSSNHNVVLSRVTVGTFCGSLARTEYDKRDTTCHTRTWKTTACHSLIGRTDI